MSETVFRCDVIGSDRPPFVSCYEVIGWTPKGTYAILRPIDSPSTFREKDYSFERCYYKTRAGAVDAFVAQRKRLLAQAEADVARFQAEIEQAEALR